MPKKCIKIQYELLSQLLDDGEEQVVIDVLFQGRKIQLTRSTFIPKRKFLLDEDISNGSLLGTGGMKQVFNIDGKAVFLMLIDNLDSLQQNIDIEISISNQMRFIGLQAQELSNGSIGIYDPVSQSYLDYPCMFADSFATLSKKKGIEVFDLKNLIRFGRKHQLFASDDEIQNSLKCKEIFDAVIKDIALLIYSGFSYDILDSINIAIMHEESVGTPIARLFLYDFSSQHKVVKTCYEPITSLDVPGLQTQIEKVLKNTLICILEADYAARTNPLLEQKPKQKPKCINIFFEIVYPNIKDELLNAIKANISKLISTSAKSIIFSSKLAKTEQRKYTYCGFEPGFLLNIKEGLFAKNPLSRDLKF